MGKNSCKAIAAVLVAIFFLAAFYPALTAAAPRYIVNGVITHTRGLAPDDDNKEIESCSPGIDRYTDYANGYSILYPSRMTVDVSLAAVRTVFSDDKTRIEVYYDNFSGTATYASDYIYYGNKFVVRSPEHAIQTDTWFEAGGSRAHLLEWTRCKLARIPGDKNNYACAEVVKNDREVYTVFIKSSEPITGAEELLAGLHLFEPRGMARNHRSSSRQPLR